MDITATNTTRNKTPFMLNTDDEKEVVANALAVYVDYLGQIGGGVEAKAEAHIVNMAREVIGGTMKDTITLRQRLVKHVGFDPTYES